MPGDQSGATPERRKRTRAAGRVVRQPRNAGVHPLRQRPRANGKGGDELLDREIFYTLAEAKVLIERWRQEYNHYRPHSSLGYRPPAPEAIEVAPLEANWLSDQRSVTVS
jgi:hypothetical protein